MRSYLIVFLGAGFGGALRHGVNLVAARLVGAASPGTVALTESTWRDLGARYKARALGRIEMKGKGVVEVVECVPEGTPA